MSWCAVEWTYSHGYTLYYGDATAHVNVARRILDSSTPGYDQTGTAWLPLPHWLMMPLVADNEMWRSGLAGAIPSGLANAVAALFLFLLARRLFDSAVAGFAAMGLYLTNPNILYLGSIPMTEPFLFATLFAMVYLAAVTADTGSLAGAAGTGLLACAGTLVRYEGWFLLPFVALFLAARRRWWCAIVFSLLAGLGPAYWLLHNQYLHGDPLEFYRGPYSAKGIYERALARNMPRYPGDQDWVKAVQYFSTAAHDTAGPVLAWLGAAGIGASLWRRVVWPVVLLAMLPVFYVLSMYSSGTPIFLPELWPNSYYNSRYGLAALPLLAVGAAAWTMAAPRRYRIFAAMATIGFSALPWLTGPGTEGWICWKESQVNSEARRAWTSQAAEYLRENYRGGGIATSFGDIAGIFQQAAIPLRETVTECNGIHHDAILARPDLFLREEWAVTAAGDAVDTALVRTYRKGPRYECVRTIEVKGAPVIRIYRRESAQGLRPPTPQEIEESRKAMMTAVEL